jgi:hypothetical protein
MSETITLDERYEALDQFAKATMPPMAEQNFPVATINNAAPAIIGAQPIAGDRRDIGRVLQEIKTLAAAAGDNWFYRFPVKNKRTGQTEFIEGPSIKCAMGVMGVMGNIEVDTRVQDFGSTFMIYARAIDVEKGSAITRAYQQNVGAAKIGGADDGRRRDMALQIGQSKAIRNSICALLETYTDFGFEEAKNSIVTRIERDPVKWRERTVEGKVRKNGIDLKRVEAVIGRTVDNWLAPDIARVIAMVTAIEDGMATKDETFPPIEKQAEAEKTSAALDEFADRQMSDPTAGDKAAPAPPEPPSSAAGAADIREEIATKLAALATDKKLSQQERLEALELYETPTLDAYPAFAEFIKAVCRAAKTVIEDDMPVAKAKAYLHALVK